MSKGVSGRCVMIQTKDCADAAEGNEMSYKTVLAPMITEKTVRVVADAALAVAGAAKGHVIGRHIRQEQYIYPGAIDGAGAGLSLGDIQASLEASALAMAKAQKGVFDEACDAAGAHQVPLKEAGRKSGLTAAWSESRGIVPAGMARAARVADLAVTALPDKRDDGVELDVIESLLMASGKPVLLVPRSGLKALPKRVLVGWDGSRAAARALEAALPMLHAATDVTLVTIKQTETGTPTLEDAESYLRLHGIEAASRIVDQPKGGVAKTLLTEAETSESDLLVLGGYSHSRFEEKLFGGVTRHVLNHADRTVLMTH